MGFSTLIDILGSTIIGGMLLLILFRINDSAVQNNYVYAGELIVQESLVEAVRLIEYDFRKIGYCKDYEKIPFPTQSILYADSNSIRFITDLATEADEFGDGILDTIWYYVSDTSALSSTSNPRDRILYRVVNSDSSIGSNIGVVQFDLLYFDAMNDPLEFPITDPSLIYTLQIDLMVENIDAVEDVYSEKENKDDRKAYSRAVWRQIRLAARNLRNR